MIDVQWMAILLTATAKVVAGVRPEDILPARTMNAVVLLWANIFRAATAVKMTGVLQVAILQVTRTMIDAQGMAILRTATAKAFDFFKKPSREAFFRVHKALFSLVKMVHGYMHELQLCKDLLIMLFEALESDEKFMTYLFYKD
ncbi:hypothetical protein H257_15412 [Aphanomyces astaci]|uniref:Uncharacterized protein n=1 Tax=Aphanomyces astaci TaxID=112090 RepID=W4FP61_APHAT|nr:hypothetical protein H257_15412 [Aphanomyces astaci]ETV68599.1 hypothetical protein H257_15412 [Aphanomyces astaci]|eukprot:XP_009841824.1 hypothetical protein H257_15412 [Aphanomyces astaci]